MVRVISKEYKCRCGRRWDHRTVSWTFSQTNERNREFPTHFSKQEVVVKPQWGCIKPQKHSSFRYHTSEMTYYASTFKPVQSSNTLVASYTRNIHIREFKSKYFSHSLALDMTVWHESTIGHVFVGSLLGLIALFGRVTVAIVTGMRHYWPPGDSYLSR